MPNRGPKPISPPTRQTQRFPLILSISFPLREMPIPRTFIRHVRGLFPTHHNFPRKPSLSLQHLRPLSHTPISKMRLPYVPDPPPTSSPEDQAIVDRVRARRAPRPLTSLDLALLHSPPVADGWNSFLGAVRTRTTLPADLRELAICRVASVNRAWYEWMHHAPLATAAGVGDEAMELVKTRAGALGDAGKPEGGLSEKQWAVLCIADEMTRNVEVSEGTFAVVKGLFEEREVVEIVSTVACYNCVSRFLVALDGELPACVPFLGWIMMELLTCCGSWGEERDWAGCGSLDTLACLGLGVFSRIEDGRQFEASADTTVRCTEQISESRTSKSRACTSECSLTKQR